MRGVRKRLIDKINTETDLGFDINMETKIDRPTLSLEQKSAGVLSWYWIVNGTLIGSTEKMTDLLKSKKIETYTLCAGVYGLSST